MTTNHDACNKTLNKDDDDPTIQHSHDHNNALSLPVLLQQQNLTNENDTNILRNGNDQVSNHSISIKNEEDDILNYRYSIQNSSDSNDIVPTATATATAVTSNPISTFHNHQNSHNHNDVVVVPSNQLNDHDVILGRGAKVNKQKGNIEFRNLVQANIAAYYAARRGDKPVITKKIVDAVRSRGGRFLQKYEYKNRSKSNLHMSHLGMDDKIVAAVSGIMSSAAPGTVVFFEIENHVALSKTSQTFRDIIAQSLKQDPNLFMNVARDAVSLTTTYHCIQNKSNRFNDENDIMMNYSFKRRKVSDDGEVRAELGSYPNNAETITGSQAQHKLNASSSHDGKDHGEADACEVPMFADSSTPCSMHIEGDALYSAMQMFENEDHAQDLLSEDTGNKSSGWATTGVSPFMSTYHQACNALQDTAPGVSELTLPGSDHKIPTSDGYISI